MPVTLTYDRKTRVATIGVELVAGEELDKPDLDASVIENHVLRLGAELLQVAAVNALHGMDAAKIDAEADKRKADIDADAKRQKAATVDSTIADAIKSK